MFNQGFLPLTVLILSELLFAKYIKSQFGRILIWVVRISCVASLASALIDYRISTSLEHTTVWGFILLSSIIIQISSFALLGLMFAGQSKGTQSTLQQISFGLSRTFLYILLPCILLTIMVLVWALLTDQPVFQN